MITIVMMHQLDYLTNAKAQQDLYCEYVQLGEGGRKFFDAVPRT